MISSLVLNWLVGPAVMFALAWLFLPDLPEYRTGLIIVGLARCIAMVIIWNDLACGDREAAAVLVALNSVFQVARVRRCSAGSTSQLLPGWLGLSDRRAATSRPGTIARSVLIFLGIPLLAGFLTRTPRRARQGPRLVRGTLPAHASARGALYGLLFTIVMLFALQGDADHQPARSTSPGSRCRCWSTSPSCGPAPTLLGRASASATQRTTTLAFTAAGNNFELAIAVAIGTFGVTSGQALAGVVGPLIEVPVLVGLVYVVPLGAPPLLHSRTRRQPRNPEATPS